MMEHHCLGLDSMPTHFRDYIPTATISTHSLPHTLYALTSIRFTTDGWASKYVLTHRPDENQRLSLSDTLWRLWKRYGRILMP